MIEKIVNACTRKLFDEFGKDCKYYVDLPEQNFTTPCFTVGVINPLMNRRRPFAYSTTVGDINEFKKAMLYKRVMPVLVQYFPKDKKGKKECFQVAERLFESLEEITLDGQIVRGVDLEMQIVEDVLQFFVTYNFFTMKSTDDDGALETVYTGIDTKS